MEWKQVIDTPYEVSNTGLIRRIGKTKLLKPGLLKSTGYYMYPICYNDGTRKSQLLHRIIASSFIPNPDNLPQIDHINRIRTDNRIENLRWVSASKNQWNTMTKVGASGHRGIRKADNDCWRAVINLKGRPIHLGIFKTLEEAVAARKEAETIYWVGN